MKVVKNRLFRFTSLSALLDLLQTKQLTLLNSEKWEDRNDVYFLEEYRKSISAEKVLAICFTRGGERFHHWKTFTSGTDGVRIEFIKDELLRQIPSENGFLHGAVRYQKIAALEEKPPLTAALPFLKRLPYGDEKEYRIIFVEGEDKNSVKRPFGIDVSCIARITLNPWIHSSHVPNLKRIIQSIDGCQKLKVGGSTLLQNERWKKVACRVAGSPSADGLLRD